MATRITYTAIICDSPSDASRLAQTLAASWTGGPRPDLIEANGAEVDLAWNTPVTVPAASVSAALSVAKGAAGNLRGFAFTHTAPGGSVTKVSRQ